MNDKKKSFCNKLTGYISLCLIYLEEEWPDIPSESFEHSRSLIMLCAYLLALGETELNWHRLAVEGLLSRNDFKLFKNMIKKQMPKIKSEKQFFELYKAK